MLVKTLGRSRMFRNEREWSKWKGTKMQRWQERGWVRMLRNGAWISWVGSNSRAWLSFGIQSFVVVSEQTNRQKEQVREVWCAGNAVRSSSSQLHFPTCAVCCQNHCTTELWWNNSELVGGTVQSGTGVLPAKSAWVCPSGQEPWIFIPWNNPFPFFLCLSRPCSYWWQREFPLYFFSFCWVFASYSVQVSEKFFLGLIS